VLSSSSAHSGSLDCGDYCFRRDDHPIRSFAQRFEIEASIEAAGAVVDRIGDHPGAEIADCELEHLLGAAA
jgi:hypothetical protein